jgi:hypothetical protein
MVWTLPLTSDPVGRATGEKELDVRSGKLQAIAAGLDQAALRAEAFLSARARHQQAVSYAAGPSVTAVPLTSPEAGLEHALSVLEPAWPDGRVNFSLEPAPGEQPTGINWDGLCQRLDGLIDSVNRQLLHFVWVDTTLDGCLIARTTIHWGGDCTTLWQPGLPPEQTTAHCRSLQLAMASRSTTLRTILAVSQIAVKIALVVATPLGPLQAMSLGWQFVHDVLMPLLNQGK